MAAALWWRASRCLVRHLSPLGFFFFPTVAAIQRGRLSDALVPGTSVEHVRTGCAGRLHHPASEWRERQAARSDGHQSPYRCVERGYSYETDLPTPPARAFESQTCVRSGQ